MDDERWDAMYRSRDQVFSGNPNPALVAEAAELAPGRALEVGCGEGADARWLAQRGWQVSATDISEVALRRAALIPVDASAGGGVTWTRADLTATPPPPDGFDLVTVQYFPLPRRADHSVVHGLLRAVRPGGTLLFATHDIAGLSPDPSTGFGPNDYYQPHDVAALMHDGWEVLVDEIRPRGGPAPAGTHHTTDAVLRARRRN